MNFKRNVLLIGCLLFFLVNVNAQVTNDKSFCLSEIVKLSETYRLTPNLSFSLSYTYADSVSTPEIVTGQTKISNGKTWTFLDSVEIIQGNEYNISLYYRDSSLIVSDKKGYEQLMQVSFLDSIFRSSSVDSVALTNIVDSLKTITAFFKPSSPYVRYELSYNFQKYRIRQVKYFIKDSVGSSTNPARIQLDISNYDSVTPIDQNIFNEWNYIYRSEGRLYTNSAYSHFTLYNYSLN